ncbi:hypothetical protein FRC10_007398 [Ceratobasidium sp. 414]|nr:hypothetical protein FRC10_007398 [Ceratobasidium sp. 414]
MVLSEYFYRLPPLALENEKGGAVSGSLALPVIPVYLGGYPFAEEDLRPVAAALRVPFGTGLDTGNLIALLERTLPCSIFEVIGEPNYFFLVTKAKKTDADFPFVEQAKDQRMVQEASKLSLILREKSPVAFRILGSVSVPEE